MADVAPRRFCSRREKAASVHAKRIDRDERDVLELLALGQLEGDDAFRVRPRVQPHERGRREEVVAGLRERVLTPVHISAERPALAGHAKPLLRSEVRRLVPALARPRVHLGGLRLADAPGRKEERRTLQHVPGTVREVSAVVDVAELVAEVALRDVLRLRRRPVDGRRLHAREPPGEEAGEPRFVGLVARGDEMDARVRRCVRELRADRPPLARRLRKADAPRRACVRKGAVRAGYRAVHDCRRVGLRDLELDDASLGPKEEPVVPGAKPLYAQEAVRIRKRLRESRGADALSVVRGERRARGEVVRVRPRAGEKPGDRELERLALHGGEFGGKRRKRLVAEVPRHRRGGLHLERDDVRKRAQPHASRGVRLEAPRNRLREGEVAEHELELASGERLAVSSAQLDGIAVRATPEKRLEDAAGPRDAADQDAFDRRRDVDGLSFSLALHLARKRERGDVHPLRDGERVDSLLGVGELEVLDAADGQRLPSVQERDGQHGLLEKRQRRLRAADGKPGLQDGRRLVSCDERLGREEDVEREAEALGAVVELADRRASERAYDGLLPSRRLARRERDDDLAALVGRVGRLADAQLRRLQDRALLVKGREDVSARRHALHDAQRALAHDGAAREARAGAFDDVDPGARELREVDPLAVAEERSGGREVERPLSARDASVQVDVALRLRAEADRRAVGVEFVYGEAQLRHVLDVYI